MTAWYAPGDDGSEGFMVGFENKPYVGSLMLTSWTVAGDDIQVEATILGLDGQPVGGQKVTWRSVPSLTIDPEGDSDAGGKARAVVKGAAAGTLSVTAALVTEVDGREKEYHSQTLSIDVLADANDISYVGSEKWPITDGIEAGEYEVHVKTNEGIPVARYPVDWDIKEETGDHVLTVTGSDGIARFALRGTTEGPRTVIATVRGQAPTSLLKCVSCHL